MASFPRGIKAVLTKSPHDVVIVSALRTPICRSYKGKLREAYPEELLATVLGATLKRNPAIESSVQDVSVGTVLSELGGSKAGRMALNHVGFPNSTCLHTVNRACASSLQSITAIAAQIATGNIDVGIAAGTESMTRNYGSRAIPEALWPALKDSPNHHARECIMPMGLTSEIVARRYDVSRADQDIFAVESHRRAALAREQGFFKDEIVPVHTKLPEEVQAKREEGQDTDGENIPATTTIVSEDDGIRANASVESMERLKPAFAVDGTSTAGNSSQVSDGAAALLLMRRGRAEEMGLKTMGKFVGSVTVGCDPDEMGVGPAIAVPKLLERFGLDIHEDVHGWELNEAFASQAVYCLRKLELEKAFEKGKVNPYGGAIALGHPLGATGARLATTLLHGLGREGGEVGVVTMCVGTGMGMAGLFVREH